MNSFKALGTLVCVLCMRRASAGYAQANSAGTNPIALDGAGQFGGTLLAGGVAVH